MSISSTVKFAAAGLFGGAVLVQAVVAFAAMAPAGKAADERPAPALVAP